MEITLVLQNISQRFEDVFNTIDGFFCLPESQLFYRPKNGGWNCAEILEHIYLTNSFLMIVADKMTVKSLKRESTPIDLTSINLQRLEEIGKANTFNWIRPEHMEPKGELSLLEVKQKLTEQKNRCIAWLKEMPNGEGCRVQTTMTVNNLGKINTYEWIYFIVQHAQRHIAQLEKNLSEWSQTQSAN